MKTVNRVLALLLALLEHERRVRRPRAQLSDQPAEQAQWRARSLPVEHLDYDWSLNATGR